jgi:two-component system response regulator HydG
VRLKSLKSKLLVVVSALVIGSSLFVTLFFAQRHCSGLFEAMRKQAEHLAHAVALEASDKILTNDLVALQKLLYYQMRGNSSIAYLIVFKNNRVLAHTFPEGVPADLVNANQLFQTYQGHSQEIAGSKGVSYLDIAWPILEGNAGILRLGFSQTDYRKQVNGLWQQMIGVTFGILLLALSVTLLFVRRVTRPLAELATATHKVNQGELGVRVNVEGDDEVAILAASFNHMVDRLGDYTSRLEEQTLELERAHHQTRTFCNIAKEVGALSTLEEIGSYLFNKLQDIMICDQMVFLFLSGGQSPLFTLSPKEFKILEDPEVTRTAELALKSLTKVTVQKEAPFEPPLVPKEFQAAARQAMIPLRHEHQPFGALVISCPRQCGCNIEEINAAGRILDQVAGVIKRAISQEIEIRDLQGRMESSPEFGGMVGKDSEMQAIYRLIENISPTDANVLIQGESGTGKELVARAIHGWSLRREKPFVVINCSALPATLLESELFGHEKGAFTGAHRQKIGRFEQAHGGTVFLDEIGEIPPSAQIKLLRVLQMHRFERVGGEKTLTVDVRVLAATNKDLLEEVKRGNFREDLYYRLNVIPICLPPLRERRNDIPLLARHFLRRFAAAQGKKIDGFSPEAMRLLMNYSWPGNVREMENSIEYATVLAKGRQLEASDLPAGLHETVPTSGRDRRPYLLEQERKLIQEVLDECAWNKKQAARRLGISRSTLYGKIKKYQIMKPTTH